MSAAAKQHRKEVAQAQAALRLAIRTERDRCAGIAEAYQQRALNDGMVGPAHVAKTIANMIRSGIAVPARVQPDPAA